MLQPRPRPQFRCRKWWSWEWGGVQRMMFYVRSEEGEPQGICLWVSWSPTKRGVRHRVRFSPYPRPLLCLASICRFSGLTQAPQKGPHGPEVGVRLGSGTGWGGGAVWDRTRRGTVRGPHRSAPVTAGEALWQGLPGKMVVFREGGAAPQPRAGEPKSLGVS